MRVPGPQTRGRRSFPANTSHATATQYRVVRVFISCPRDCQTERDSVKRLVQEISRTQGKGYGVTLEAWSCDQDVIVRFGPDGQSVVDQQLPDYDLYLGIMSHQFGTADPAGRFQSGTEHEFDRAYERWQKTERPWLMFFFNTKPLETDSEEILEQRMCVLRFRKRVTGKGYLGEYKGPGRDEGQFAYVVGEQLRMWLQDKYGPRSADGVLVEATSALTFPPAYRAWLEKKCAEVETLGARVQQGQAIRLNHVYVPLQSDGGSDSGTAPAVRSDREPGGSRRTASDRSLLDQLAKRSLYVPGAPGAGKSTFCRWVAFLTCRGEVPPHPVAAEIPESFPEDFAGRLPVLVPLREFWPSLPQQPKSRDLSATALERALADWLAHRATDGLTWPVVAAHLENGSALLLFDGLDEVPLEHGADGWPRTRFLAGLAEANARWTQAGNRLLLTSRPYALDPAEAHRLGLDLAPLDPLDAALQALLVRRWFHTLGTPDVAALMLEHLGGRKELADLVFSPLLLTALCVIFGQGKKLPEHKHELYERIVEAVLANRFPEAPSQSRQRRSLEAVAQGMHTGEGLDERRSVPQAEITEDEIQRVLQWFRNQQSWADADDLSPERTREKLLSESGLLLPEPNQRAKFLHLTFQEFLAAQRLLADHRTKLPGLFAQHAAQPEWRNTLSFLFASLLAKNATPDQALELLRALLAEATQRGPSDATALGLAIAAGDALEILLGQKIEVPDALCEFQAFCRRAIDDSATVRERNQLALLLGRLGDPRVVSDLRGARDAFVEVPAGAYVFGREKKPFRIAEPFWLSRYPVTNEQFRRFLEADGYGQESHWTPEGWQWRTKNDIREPSYWHDPRFDGPTQPVVGVSWYEADAFAKWLGGTLPTERQWEAAARGAQGFDYPWGGPWEKGICNADYVLGATSPVGIFPRSRAPCGADDMAGNVWEWCADWYDMDKDARVLRGGAWGPLRDIVRAAFRAWNSPEFREDHVGFRVCVASLAFRTR